jgi:hypothetical protein
MAMRVAQKVLKFGGSAHEDCTRGVCDVTKPSGAFGGIFLGGPSMRNLSKTLVFRDT